MSDPSTPLDPDRDPKDVPPDDEEVMTVLGSSHDSVTDYDELLDTVPDEDEVDNKPDE